MRRTSSVSSQRVPQLWLTANDSFWSQAFSREQRHPLQQPNACISYPKAADYRLLGNHALGRLNFFYNLSILSIDLLEAQNPSTCIVWGFLTEKQSSLSLAYDCYILEVSLMKGFSTLYIMPNHGCWEVLGEIGLQKMLSCDCQGGQTLARKTRLTWLMLRMFESKSLREEHLWVYASVASLFCFLV